MIYVDGSMSLQDIYDVVFHFKQIRLSPDTIQQVKNSASYVRKVAEAGDIVYGITTGFGANRDTIILPADAELLQENLIISHACGVGDPFPELVSRAMMVLRIIALSKGFSAIRIETLQYLIELVNNHIHPVIPRHGSVGASGDLCPLAHMCLPMLGLGKATYKGNIITGSEVLNLIGLPKAKLTYKEGLALLNGTQAMTAVGLVAAKEIERLILIADAVATLSLEAHAGRIEAFDERIHILRGRHGQIVTAKNVRSICEGSQLVGCSPGAVAGKTEFVQDSYCFRCIPQVHGATRDVLDYFYTVLETEANAVTDNPIVFQGFKGEFSDDVTNNPGVLSGGNFHGQPIAMALDYLKIAVAELGSISERRIALLTDKKQSDGLPAFLASHPGLHSGLMVAQYVAASLVADNKIHAHPASVDSIPTSANTEDHVSMGMNGAIHLLSVIENLTSILSIELLASCQGIDLRGDKLAGKGSSKLLELFRKTVPFMDRDRVISEDIELAKRVVKGDDLYALLQDLC